MESGHLHSRNIQQKGS